MSRSLLLVAVGLLAVSADNAKTNPMSKVIQLIDDLSAKITREGEAEAAAYKEYFEWCDSTAKNGRFAIEEATTKKEKLEATIKKATSDIEAASTKIDELAASIAEDEAELKSATTVREKELAEFTANEAELVDAVDTLSRAIGIIDKEMAKTGAAFAQVDVSSMSGLLKAVDALVDAAAFPNADKKKLLALVQSNQADEADDEELGAPAAKTYQSQSGGILDILEDMKEKAETELAQLRKAETNAKHNFNMLKQSLEDSIKADTDDLNETKAAKAASEELKATSEKDLAGTVKDLEDATAALNTCHANCMQTAADHEASVKSRNEELTAIAKAKEILSETSKGAVDQSYSLLQLKAQSQMRTRTDLKNAEVITIVKKLAKEHHSAALAQLASKIQAIVSYSTASGEDPFAKIKGLISDLIAKLEAEALEEANEKAYCDEQIAKTNAKKDELNADLAKLVSKIDTAAASSAGLKEEVKELQAELATLAKEQAELDAIRQETHADYAKAKAELELGLDGVRKALSVLREYYGGAAAGAAMLQEGEGLGAMMRQQEKQPAMPEFHGKSSGSGGSIIDILEVCESDFAKNLAAEETQEADAESEYQATTFKNKQTKTLKDQDVKYKTQNFKNLDKEIGELSADKATTSSELAAVLEYDKKIKDRCIAEPETYEERKKRREAEIAGLKSALDTLENETAFMQRGKRATGRRSHYLRASQ